MGADAASSRQDASPGLVLLIVCAGVVLASLDLFIVNVALPQMGRDFHLRGGGLGDLSWVLNAYAIVYAALLVLFGRIAERYPRERGFLLGVALFVAASAACGAASSLADAGRVPGRAGRGSGAADADLARTGPGELPAGAPAWRRADVDGGGRAGRGPWPGHRRAAGRGELALGVLRQRPDRSGWRSWSAGDGSRTCPASRYPGPTLSRRCWSPSEWACCHSAWSKATRGAGTTPGRSPRSAVAVLAIALFAAHTAWSRNPLIDRALFKLRPFTGASAVAILFSASFGAMLLSRVLWAQEVWHWSPLITGLSIAPGTADGSAVLVPASPVG